jgi:hypothetical protein
MKCALFLGSEWLCDLPFECAVHLQRGDEITAPDWRNRRPGEPVERIMVEILEKRWNLAPRHDSDPVLELYAELRDGRRRCDHEWQTVINPGAPSRFQCGRCHAWQGVVQG